jgi:hypothetical protein
MITSYASDVKSVLSLPCDKRETQAIEEFITDQTYAFENLSSYVLVLVLG